MNARHRHPIFRLFSLLLVIIAASPSLVFATPEPTIDPESSFFIPATGQTISAPLLAWWTENDGARQLGLPITSGIETDLGSIQYFEFGAVQTLKGDAFHRLPVGTELVAALYSPRNGTDGKHRASASPTNAFGRLSDAPSGDSVIFDETTGHAIKGRFASAYNRLGGIDTLGRPISEAYSWGPGRVQWFEYGRLTNSGDETVISRSGRELALRRGESLAASSAGGRREVRLERYANHHGDGELDNQSSVFAPVEISIPALGVDAAVETVPIVSGVMQTPQDVWAVGWYYDLPAPGQYSNVVMAGHRDWWNVGPVVFYNLDLLVPGDAIYLTADDGTGATYQVTEVQVVDADIDAGVVVSDKGADTLTLITCGGDFDGAHYLSRVIVYSVRI